MAYPPIPYRASEPSQMETQLAVLATDPARAGAAMQLLPGAAAIRQDIGARANMEADRDAALAAITQQQNALNQRNEARLKTYALTQPGMTAAAMQTPELADLFAGSSPNVAGLVNAGTEGAFRAQGAKTNLELQQGYDYGVKSGNVVPPDVVNSQLGYKTQTMLPESLRLQGMKDAAAMARQNASADQLNTAKYGWQVVNGQLTPTGSGPPGTENTVAGNLLMMGKHPPTIGKDEQGNEVVQPGFQPQVVGVPTNRRTKVPGEPRVIDTSSPTRAAGAQLPSAPGSSRLQPATTMAPGNTGQTGTVVTRGAPVNKGDQLLSEYIKRQSPGEQAALTEMKRTGALNFGRDASGNVYITKNGQPVLGPLPLK